MNLKNIIQEQLSPLISKECIILDAPYYHNIGDILIWEGEREFIRKNQINCIYTASYETCTFPLIDPNVTILFQGGGNLGDIYPEHANFLIRIIQKYPSNRIIIFPQTAFFKNKSQEVKVLKQIQEHKDLFLCARDKTTYDLLYPYLGEKTMLVPDMAFYINSEIFNKYKVPIQKKKLYIKRTDCEQVINQSPDSLVDTDISDWPVFEHSFRRSTFLNKLFKRIADLNIPLISPISNRIWDYYTQNIFSKLMIQEGVRFISQYEIVETTRLHGAILAILLDKEVIINDNSYGKNRHFYETWLSKKKNVSFK